VGDVVVVGGSRAPQKARCIVLRRSAVGGSKSLSFSIFSLALFTTHQQTSIRPLNLSWKTHGGQAWALATACAEVMHTASDALQSQGLGGRHS